MESSKAKIVGKRYVSSAKNAVEVMVTRCIGKYMPGQYIRVYVACNDPKPFREMNLTSIPDDDYLSFAFRISDSEWKRTILGLKYMDEVTIKGPYGLFVLPSTHARIAMIASNIGITPFMSMVRYSISRGIYDITLLYINKSRDDAPYIDDLESLVCNNFRLFEAFSTKDIMGWIKNMRRYGIERWYVSGEPAYARVVRQLLIESGIDIARISVEEFIGYN